MPTCLFGGPPDLDDLVKLGNSQIGFMNIFAGPLFDSMSHILPDMDFTIMQINHNKDLWQQTIDAEKKRIEQQDIQKHSIVTQPETGSSDNYRSDSEQMSHPNQPPGLTHDSSHKSSATSDTPQFTSASSSRRQSLGPTVIPNSKTPHIEGSARSSGGSPRDFPEMQGLSEAISDQLQLDGTHSLGGNLKTQENGPIKTDIHGHDALPHVNMSAPNVHIPRQHQARDLKSPSAADLSHHRGFNKKTNWATQTYPAGDVPNPRRTKRKFSLRFWRKTDREVR